MYVSISQHVIKKSSEIKGNQLSFKVHTPQTKMLEITSYEKNDMSSGYNYDPLLEKVLTSAYMQFPVYAIFESYSDEIVENMLSSNNLKFDILKKSEMTTFYKVQINKIAEYRIVAPILYESGTDSLFNVITMSNQVVSFDQGEAELNVQEDMNTPSFCFSHDLQGLCIIGDDKWKDKTFIKKAFLKDSIILDEVDFLS